MKSNIDNIDIVVKRTKEYVYAGYTKEEIAKKLDLTYNQISHIYRTKLKIDLKTVRRRKRIVAYKTNCIYCKKDIFSSEAGFNVPSCCSRQCYSSLRKLMCDKSKRVDKRGVIKYKMTAVGRKSNGKLKYVSTHRLIMEKHLGRKLKPGERVWFKDGDSYNLSLDNLEIGKFNNKINAEASRRIGNLKNKRSVKRIKIQKYKLDKILANQGGPLTSRVEAVNKG